MMSELKKGLKIQVDLNLLVLTTEIKDEQHMCAVHVSGAIIANNCVIDDKFLEKYGAVRLILGLAFVALYNEHHKNQIRQIAKKIENYINEQTA